MSSASLHRALGTLRPPIRKVGPSDTPPARLRARLPETNRFDTGGSRLAGLVFALQIIRQLEAGRVIVVTAIAEELGIQRRTAFRYLIAIEQAGYPLYEYEHGAYRLLRKEDL